ncbi:MAG TPA: flagellar biosynthesis protein FlhB [Beijerinckiaceae bacterium]|jgi:flagellar biosynthetic protein FlhB
MAEDVDPDSKTEDPSEKKTRDALEKGNVPNSREVAIFGSLLGAFLSASFLFEPFGRALADALTGMIDDAGGLRLATGADATALMLRTLLAAAAFAGPALLLIMALGVAAAMAQGQPRMVFTRIEPKMERISPIAGFKRLFGSQGRIEFLKLLFKFTAVAIVAAVIVYSERLAVVDSMLADPMQLPSRALAASLKLVAALLLASGLLVVLDVIWSRWTWLKQLRMTKQEVKDEFKEIEGDPLIKARLRSLALDRRRRRMIAAVPRATLVIANPTHFAVALRYVREESAAPVVVAKGQDHLALRIRAVAEENGVPVVEDKALARSLYKAVEVDQLIHPEFYRAVAEIILFLQKRRVG